MNNTGTKQPEILIDIRDIWKSFTSGGRKLEVLKGTSFHCDAGELLAVMGPSGCGKTTLLNLISGLDTVDRGEVLFRGRDLIPQAPGQWDSFRRQELGMIFQFNQLLPEFSALENTLLPTMIIGASPDDSEERARHLLGRLGLEDRLSHRPAQLSGGEQQRIAIARALMNGPSLILADEPTGSLDHESGMQVFKLLRNLQEEMGFSCLIVTHNRELAGLCDRIINLNNETGSEPVNSRR